MTILTNKKLMISFSSIGRLLSHVPALKKTWLIYFCVIIITYFREN